MRSASGAMVKVPPKYFALAMITIRCAFVSRWRAGLAMPDLEPLVAEELLDRGVLVEEDALEPPDALDVLEDGDVEAEAGDVEEVLVLDAADVDERVGTVDGELRHPVDVRRRDAEGLGEVVPRAGGDDREPRLGSRRR